MQADMKETQQERILSVLRVVRSSVHEVPEEYVRRRPDGDGVSVRNFKREPFPPRTSRTSRTVGSRAAVKGIADIKWPDLSGPDS
jgi:hypothetical protein